MVLFFVSPTHAPYLKMPTSPQAAHTLSRVFLQLPSIPCSPFQGRMPHKHWKKFKHKPRIRSRTSNNAHAPWPTYL